MISRNTEEIGTCNLISAVTRGAIESSIDWRLGMADSGSFVGHVQCSRGLTNEAFLAACIDAVSLFDRQNAAQVLHHAQSWCSSNLKFTGVGIVAITIRQEHQTSMLSLESNINDNSAVIADEVSTIFGLAQGKDKSKQLEWITVVFLGMVRNLVEELCKSTGCSSRDIRLSKSELYYALLYIYCLEKLGIRRLYCVRPIPFDPLHSEDNIFSTSLLQELLVGLPVQTLPPENIVQPSTMILALLKFLGSADGSTGQSQPALVLDTTGTGRCSSSGAVVALMVGAEEQKTLCTITSGDRDEGSSPLWPSDQVTQMECNLDDITGEILAHTIEQLLNAGAYDAWVTPIIMKKGRPAHTFHCLCKPDREDQLVELLFRHTTTLGIRLYRKLPRAKLCRSLEVAQTPYTDTTRNGKVNVKVSSFRTGEVVSMKAEFDHCEEISRQSGHPLKFVGEAALDDIRNQLNGKGASIGT